MKNRPSYEQVYERVMMEHENNPLVGSAYYETIQFLTSLGYSYSGAVCVVRRLERIYELNLYRRPRDNHHTLSGAIIEREFGITKKSNKIMYDRLMSIFYNRTVLKKWSVEKALKLLHERYDHLLDKDCAEEQSSDTIAIPLSGRALYQDTAKTCKDFDIEW